MPTFVNLLPHALTLVLPSGRERAFPPSGTVARVEPPAPQTDTVAVDGEAVEVRLRRRPTEVTGLPAPRPGTYYLVSTMLARAAPERDDLLAPATGPDDDAVRDEDGQITAVTRFQRPA